MTDIGGGQQAANIEGDPRSKEHIARQQQEFAESQKAAAAAEAGQAYPRVYSPHTRWVDETPGQEQDFTGTQYGFNTEAEAVARIDAARAAGKQVLYMNREGGSYVSTEVPGDFRVTIED